MHLFPLSKFLGAWLYPSLLSAFLFEIWLVWFKLLFVSESDNLRIGNTLCCLIEKKWFKRSEGGALICFLWTINSGIASKIITCSASIVCRCPCLWQLLHFGPSSLGVAWEKQVLGPCRTSGRPCRSFWLLNRPGPALAIRAIWRVKQCMEDPFSLVGYAFLSVGLCFSLWHKKIDTFFKKKNCWLKNETFIEYSLPFCLSLSLSLNTYKRFGNLS